MLLPVVGEMVSLSIYTISNTLLVELLNSFNVK